jgi:caa(3)-type oxidase subunit IV
MEYSVALYTKVLLGLLLLTLLTFVQPPIYHLTPGKTIVVQLVIAFMKIGLVITYYMHLRSEKEYLKWYLVMAAGIVLIFFIIVGIDVVNS